MASLASGDPMERSSSDDGSVDPDDGNGGPGGMRPDVDVDEPIAVDVAGASSDLAGTSNRDHIPTQDLIGGRLQQHSLSLISERFLQHQNEYLTFFQNPSPNTAMLFSWVSIGNLVNLNSPLYETVLSNTSSGEHKAGWNRMHATHSGTWFYDDPPSPQKFLDIQLPIPWVHLALAPDLMWFRFQRLPGTTTWVRSELGRPLSNVIVLSSLDWPFWPGGPR